MWFQRNIFQPREIQRSCCGKPIIQIQITSAGQNETQKLIRSVMLHLIINNTQQPRCVCKVKGIGRTKEGTVQLPHRKGFDAIKSRPRWAGPTKAFYQHHPFFGKYVVFCQICRPGATIWASTHYYSSMYTGGMWARMTDTVYLPWRTLNQDLQLIIRAGCKHFQPCLGGCWVWVLFGGDVKKPD